MARWSKNNPPPVGNPTGKNNSAGAKLKRKFVEAYLADFEVHGPSILKIVRIEDPVNYLKLGVTLVPRELQITSSAVEELSDEDLDSLLERARKQLEASAIDITPNKPKALVKR
jgi:hypothetical protein